MQRYSSGSYAAAAAAAAPDADAQIQQELYKTLAPDFYKIIHAQKLAKTAIKLTREQKDRFFKCEMLLVAYNEERQNMVYETEREQVRAAKIARDEAARVYLLPPDEQAAALKLTSDAEEKKQRERADRVQRSADLAPFVGDVATGEYMNVTQQNDLIALFEDRAVFHYEAMFRYTVKDELWNHLPTRMAFARCNMSILENAFNILSELFQRRYWEKLHDVMQDWPVVDMGANQSSTAATDLAMMEFLAQEMVNVSIVTDPETKDDNITVPTYLKLDLLVERLAYRFIRFLPDEGVNPLFFDNEDWNKWRRERLEITEVYFQYMLALFWAMITRNPSMEVRFPKINERFDAAWMGRHVSSETTRCIYTYCLALMCS